MYILYIQISVGREG